ncbi:protein of unknown function [Prosthecobacter debontii]|uniref:DNA mimic protein DMP19 C-terminal domain-containing protein n=1 Tax=Prosthecobacter debontii TaxID=48467 RepID=A0A1T4YEW8_9BACT|nr:DUF4375 domain-containing protein [Prosthecobacter debontii]SKB00240.1 protein of unknown function [Prosthecobacter debontii]
MWPFTRKKSSPQQPLPPVSPGGDKAASLVEKHTGAFFGSLQQRPKWRHITAETLAAIPDDELEIAIFDIVWAMPIKSLDQSLTTLSELGIGYQTIYTTLQLETEVSNGGFQQYFYNSTRHYFPMAREGYQRLGLTTLVQIADAAKAAYDEELAMKPPQTEAPDEQLDEFMSRYEDSKVDLATDRFYAEKEAAKSARTTYIRQHPDQFFGDFRDRYK